MAHHLASELPPDWREVLKAELTKPYWLHLEELLNQAEKDGKIVYPARANLFAALHLTPFAKVKAVILGQDPYHGPKQATGLSFSVPEGLRLPPSLRNIYKELAADVGITIPRSGDLSAWAEAGVLLLNTVLTVEAGRAASHAGQGWEHFTGAILDALNDKREHLAFVLWGAQAQRLAKRLDRKKHLVIESVHPSPLSAHRGFFGSKPFSQINSYLSKHAISEIDWRLTRASAPI